MHRLFLALITRPVTYRPEWHPAYTAASRAEALAREAERAEALATAALRALHSIHDDELYARVKRVRDRLQARASRRRLASSAAYRAAGAQVDAERAGMVRP